MNSDSITLTKPDDWHVHLRDGDALKTTVPHTAKCFGRAIIMPNLSPPLTNVAAALGYRDRILAARPEGNNFEPLMTLFLTDSLALDEIDLAQKTGAIAAIKYYPAGATTNSENGVTNIQNTYPVLERLADIGMPLLIHGEVSNGSIDIFDREQQFIDSVLTPLLNRYPTLKLVLEHISTSHAVEFVLQQPENVAATITAHHLLFNRNDLLSGGVRPHFYCLPILKNSNNQQALIEAATSGSPKFFLGTDSAPHLRSDKEAQCGCAGIYSAPAAIELYAEVFDNQGALDKLESFACFHGPDFYALPRNKASIKLHRNPWQMPENFLFAEDVVVPIRAGATINWQLEETT